MARPRAFAPVKIVCGIIFGPDAVPEAEARRLLLGELGPIDHLSDPFDFDLTDYYRAEMGEGLRRRFVSFERLAEPEALPTIKLRTNAIEETVRRSFGRSGRPVNIDPGYLTASALVMATAKDFSHRIPLAHGIYAHLELLFTRTDVRVLEWTYPDMRRPGPLSFFRQVRQSYLAQLRGKGGSEGLQGPQSEG